MKKIIYVVLAVCMMSCSSKTERDEEVPAEVKKEMSVTDKKIIGGIDNLIHTNPHIDPDSLAVSVYNLTRGQQVFSFNDTLSVIPASCMKIPTALATLHRYGMNHRFYESLQIRGEMVGDTLRGNLLFVADADPLFESFDELMAQFARTGIRHIDGNIYLALEMEEPLRAHPTAKAWDIVYHKLPILLRGRKFVTNRLLYSLRLAGVTFHKNTSVNPKQRRYRKVAMVSSRLTDVMIPMLIHSSNIKAEAVLFHADNKAGLLRKGATHYDAETHVTDLFFDKVFFSCAEEDKMLDGKVANRSQMHVEDGSGLSPDNRMTARFLVELFRYAYQNEAIRNYFINEALTTPNVPGRTGSFMSRLSRPEYTGRVYSKTGTLTSMGVSSLAGFIKANNDEWYAYTIIVTGTPIVESKLCQDQILKMVISPK